MRLNKYLTQLTTRSVGVVSGQSFGSSVVSLACITSMCLVQCSPGGHSLHSAFGSFFYRLILAVFCCSVKLCSFFVVFGYAWLLCNRCFFIIWGDNLGSLRSCPLPINPLSLTGRGHDTFVCQITCKKAKIWTFF